ncbi:hypothetical protein [Phytohabitans flavus]|uniref:hypothetical protein n=1 Tax=Phytohabitans flavus TaxID=1076124 RepID=UPI00156751BC|nr:hypothetical protein [Phytohabitans flavus]
MRRSPDGDDDDPDVRAQWREVGRLLVSALAWALYAVGWLVAKSLRGAGAVLGWLLFAAGYAGARALRPALIWCRVAVRLGWHAGLKPGRPGAGPRRAGE